MAHSPLTTEIRLTRQRTVGRGGERPRVLQIHHTAGGTHDGVVSMMVSGSREVSAQYVVSERITLVVDETDRAWTSGSAAWDRRSITFEVLNSRAGDPWPVSDRTFHNLARLMADCATRHGISLDDTQVITHQELYRRHGVSYPTACPGSLQARKAELIALARHYQGKGPVPAAGVSPARPAVDYAWGLSRGAQRALQQFLRGAGYTGPIDGVFGPASVRALQGWLIQQGHLPAHYHADGIPGGVYGAALQRIAQRFGYQGPVDGHPGSATSAAIERWLAGTPSAPVATDTWHRASGLAGAPHWPHGPLMVRIQRALRARGRYDGPADGIPGPETAKAIQRTLTRGAGYTGPGDGELGAVGARLVQEYARRWGDYRGPIDGDPRAASWGGFALGLERP